MKTREMIFCAAVLFGICFTPSAHPADSTPPEFPSNSGGELAQAFVAAINGSEAQVRAFVSTHVPTATAYKMTPEKWEQLMLKLRQQSGGLDLKKDLGSSEHSARLMLESRQGAHRLGVEIACKKTDPSHAASLELHPMPGPNTPKPKPLPKEKVSEAEIPEAIAQHLSETAALDLFSGVVLVAKDDQILLHQACGMANNDLDLTNRIDTRFGSASVGKMFTGVAIGQLVEAGKLKFEDTIGSALPDYPNREAATNVTIHHLLTHTSGIADPFESKDFKSGFIAPRQRDWFPLFANEPLGFKPGARHRYSNGGYVVLGAIIEKLSGQSFTDYVCQHIFRPAAMRDTGCLAQETERTSIAAPHQRPMMEDPLGIEPRRVKTTTAFKHDAAGMGGWQTTTDDLFRFARAVRTNGLLSAAMTAQITSGKASVFGDRVKYGYGFYDIEAKGDRMIGHS